MRSWLVNEISTTLRDAIEHLRIELVNATGADESGAFFYEHQYKLRYFAKLNQFDLSVSGGILYPWTRIFEDTQWGSCPVENVRVVIAVTGEYVDVETSRLWEDYQRNREGGGGPPLFDRNASADEIRERSRRPRLPLPQIDL
jgi:hypothetical protein